MEDCGIFQLRNPVREYAWGSRTAIPELLGREAASAPQAELWMGAHPLAPSQIETAQGVIGLDRWIAGRPESSLGAGAVERFGPDLPFLFKVLAAEHPLSLQAHPSREQARAGFARENAAGLALDHPRRCYRDPNHKPELLCAVSRFHALCRFRPIPEIAAGFAALGAPDLAGPLEALRATPGEAGLARFFEALWGLPEDTRRRVLDRARAPAADAHGEADPWHWVGALLGRHPEDIGALAPLLLNLVELDPGDALFLPAGELHAYLAGTALELMANSDNVLRGGLTAKHVDVPELLATLHYRAGPTEILRPVGSGPGVSSYATPAEEFRLSVLEVEPSRPIARPAERSAEILFVSSADTALSLEAGGRRWRCETGSSWWVAADAPYYVVEGRGTVYRASVPV